MAQRKRGAKTTVRGLTPEVKAAIRASWEERAKARAERFLRRAKRLGMGSSREDPLRLKGHMVEKMQILLKDPARRSSAMQALRELNL